MCDLKLLVYEALSYSYAGVVLRRVLSSLQLLKLLVYEALSYSYAGVVLRRVLSSLQLLGLLAS